MKPTSELSSPPPLRRRLIRLCLALVLAGSAVGIALPAGLGWDFANFYDTGRRVMAGEYHHLYDEYSTIAGEAPQGHMRFYGVPVSAFFYAPLAWFGPETASRLLKFQGFAAFATGLWFLYTSARQFVTMTDERHRWFANCFAIAMLAYQPFWTIYRVGGQTTPTIFLLMVAALWTYVGGRVLSTAFLLTAVILIKPAFVLSAGLLAVASGWQLCLALASFGLVSAAMSVWLVGYPVHVDFWNLMITSAKTSVGWVYNSAATVAIENLRLPDDPYPVRSPRPLHLTRYVEGMRLILGVIFLMNAWRIKRVHRFRHRESSRLMVYLASLVFGLALMPIVWEHYLSLLFLPLIYALAVQDRLPAAARAITWLALGLASVQNLIVIQWLHDHLPVMSWPAALMTGLLKGGPILLTVWLWTRYNGDLCRELDRGPVDPDGVESI
jgi:hypothetical protein